MFKDSCNLIPSSETFRPSGLRLAKAGINGGGPDEKRNTHGNSKENDGEISKTKVRRSHQRLHLACRPDKNRRVD